MLKTGNINRYSLILLLFTLLGIISCRNEETIKQIKNLTGKHIRMPQKISRQSEFAIVNYVDTTGCTSCKLRPTQWNTFIENAKKQNILIDVIFIVHPNVYSDVKEIIRSNCKDIIVLKDDKNRWIKEHALPHNEMLHTFLIDGSNNVVIIGTPTTNKKIGKMMLDYCISKEI